MEKLGEATLLNGKKLPYVITDNPPRGGMKYTYFAPDRSYVVQFFNDGKMGNDTDLRARLEAIIGRFNPTLAEEKGGAKGNSPQIADYFSKRFCWPVGIVNKPEFGIVCPAYPSNYFFQASASSVIHLQGKDKRSNWFTTSNRKYLDKSELGDFRSMLSMSILLARTMRRLHQAGLAHSDLSHNNVLIDPKSGNCVVIDIDSLVVPGIFPPEVIGTRGYIAPEILETLTYHSHDPERRSPSTVTDLHSMAVLIYEYLFYRHPLIGPKIYSTRSAEEDDYLALGPQATFIEDPNDKTNRPKGLKPTIETLGPVLQKLFLRAFSEGLHHPNLRPSAMEWERGLLSAWNLLHACQNPVCEHKCFILHNSNHPVCPFCGMRIRNEQIVRFHMYVEARGRCGQWLSFGEIDICHNSPLFLWHILSNVFPDEKADRTMEAYVSCQNGHWLVVNQNVEGMISPQGISVPKGHFFKIEDGDVFLTTRQSRGILIEVSIKRV